MMKLLLSALLLSSFSVFASDFSLEEALYEVNDDSLIKRALYNELVKSGLNCAGDYDLDGVTTNFQKHILNNSTSTLTANETSSTPFVITSYKLGSYEYEFEFKVAADLKRISSMKFVIYRFTTVEKNTGTLFRPRIEEIVERTATFSTECKSNQKQ